MSRQIRKNPKFMLVGLDQRSNRLWCEKFTLFGSVVPCTAQRTDRDVLPLVAKLYVCYVHIPKVAGWPCVSSAHGVWGCRRLGAGLVAPPRDAADAMQGQGSARTALVEGLVGVCSSA